MLLSQALGARELTALVLVSAASLGVKLACASDYSAHCGNHPVGSAGLRKCMRSHGSHLSSGCVTALVAAGEVSKAEVDRRRAAKAKTVARN